MNTNACVIWILIIWFYSVLRYDVRGALYDLKEAESGGGGDRWEGLTEEERAEEEKCDQERYLALYHDEFQYQEYQGKYNLIHYRNFFIWLNDFLCHDKVWLRFG